MESIIWFLILGALFYFMMRFGCGAHIGGHGGHGNHEDHMGEGEGPLAISQKVKDPVCGMEVHKDQAYAMTHREGKQVYFCSENCQNKFNEDPKKYL